MLGPHSSLPLSRLCHGSSLGSAYSLGDVGFLPRSATETVLKQSHTGNLPAGIRLDMNSMKLVIPLHFI